MSRVTIVAASVFIAGSMLGINGQTPSPSQPTFRSAINFVELPVRVTDSQGNFVRGLQQSNFQLFEDGNRQEVASFTLVDVPLPDPKKPAMQPAGASAKPFVLREGESVDGRVYLIVLDDYHLLAQYSFRVKSIVQSFVKQRMGPQDVAAVVYTSVTRGQDFTQDRLALLASLDRFMGALDTSAGFETQNANSVAALDKIRSMIGVLGKIKGRHKALLFMSPSLGCFTQRQAIAEFADSTAPDTPALRCYNSLRDSVREAVQANVSVYSFDPTNIGNPGWVSPSIDGRGGPGAALQRARAADGNPVNVFDGMRVLAEDTGGFTVTNVNNFDKALDRIVQQHSSYYLLGYYSTNDKMDGKIRRNAVALDRPELKVVYRPTYAAPRN